MGAIWRGPAGDFYTGRSEDAGVMVMNGRTGDGGAILNEVPGYMKRTEVAGWDAENSIRVSVMYDTDVMPFERRLATRRGVHDGRCVPAAVQGTMGSTIRDGGCQLFG